MSATAGQNCPRCGATWSLLHLPGSCEPPLGSTVTCTDHDSGESKTMDLPPDNFVLCVGELMEVANVQAYANGTTVLTIKRRAASE